MVKDLTDAIWLSTTPPAARLPRVMTKLLMSPLAVTLPETEPLTTRAEWMEPPTVTSPEMTFPVVPSPVTLRASRSPATSTDPVIAPWTVRFLRVPPTVSASCSSEPVREWSAPTEIRLTLPLMSREPVGEPSRPSR
jgi:hypothetical protein